jgi:hypothetical protein
MRSDEETDRRVEDQAKRGRADRKAVADQIAKADDAVRRSQKLRSDIQDAGSEDK